MAITLTGSVRLAGAVQAAGAGPVAPPSASYYIGTLTGLEADSGNNIVADNSGYAYMLGAGKVVKLGVDGSISWQKSLSASTTDLWGAVDSSDNLHVTQGSTVVKYNSSGTIQWQRSLVTASWRAVAVDSSSNVYLCGILFSSPTDIIVAKYNSSGAIQWQRKLATSSNVNDAGYGVAVDSSGNVYVGGADQTNKGYVAKYNSSGTIQWQKSLANAFSLDFGYITGRVGSVAVDSSGNVYVGLELLYTVASTASMDVLLVKFDSSGTTLWQRRLSGSGADRPDYFTGMTTDSAGNTYLTSRSGSTNAINMFKYNSSGTIQWQRDLVTNASATNYGVGGISVSSNRVFACGTVTVSGSKGGLFAALPLDGTLTATYSLSTVTGGSVTYRTNTTFTDSAGALTIATSSLTASTPTLTEQAGALSETTPSLTLTKVSLGLV